MLRPQPQEQGWSKGSRLLLQLTAIMVSWDVVLLNGVRVAGLRTASAAWAKTPAAWKPKRRRARSKKRPMANEVCDVYEGEWKGREKMLAVCD